MFNVRSEENGYPWERNDKESRSGFLVVFFFFPSFFKKKKKNLGGGYKDVFPW